MSPPAPSLPCLLLASSSPRRSDLLRDAGLEFQVVRPGVEERHDPAEPAGELAAWNARLKAAWVAERHPDALVIGADTLVSLDGEALAKPADLEEAHRMVKKLAGRSHSVLTAVCLCWPGAGDEEGFLVETRVTFRSLSDEEIRAYHGLVDPLDKAGGYAAQEHGDRILAAVEGSWSNVVGLPMEALVERLRKAGWP